MSLLKFASSLRKCYYSHSQYPLPQNQALRRQGDIEGSKHLQCLPSAVTCQSLIPPVWEKVTARELSVSSEEAEENLSLSPSVLAFRIPTFHNLHGKEWVPLTIPS